MAKEYIEREAAIKALTSEALVRNLDSVADGIKNRYHRAAERVIASVPTAEVEPVRHGKWVYNDLPTTFRIAPSA